MTGLDPKRHVIVEVATLITDDDLNIIAEGPDLVIKTTQEELDQMDDVVIQMHSRSGLMAELAFSSITLEDATSQTLAFIQSHIPKQRSAPLCGNSIGTDRRFLAEHMPVIEDWLHYRSIDVSSIKELARRWYPEELKAAPQKAMGHRAMDDIKESVTELRYYREALFKPVTAKSPDSDEKTESKTANGSETA